MGQRDERIIVGVDAWPTAIEVGVDVAHGPEENERLVDEMAPEVEEKTAGFVRRAALAPAARRDRSPTLEARFEPDRIADHALRKESPKRKEITIPSSILKWNDEPATTTPRISERARLARRGRERLVYHDVQPGRDRSQRQRNVSTVWRRDRNEIEAEAPVPELGHVVDDANARVSTRRRALTIGVTCHDCR